VLYDALSSIYDRMMSHVVYEEWVELIEGVADRYLRSSRPAVFELGGGTGVLGALLRRKGFPYVGSDCSFGMCCQSKRRKALVTCADARALPIKKSFDLIIFLYDGINYLQSLDDYARLFAEAAACLIPGGCFLFDITTETNSFRHFRDYLESEDWGDYAYIRRSYFSRDTRLQHNDITIFKRLADKAPFYQKIVERHCQKVFSANAIAEAVPASLFSILGIWDGFSMKDHRPHSERIHFLLKKTGS
jgi:SAM-dependent methyltransferase